MSSPLDALVRVHDELWDTERGMARYARGVTPGIDVSSLGLHSVRETALGAFLDLEAGNANRAVTAIRNVLALQSPPSDRPWSGTFPVTAEQPEPPEAGAVEWVHYDPNWRQFLGCILALTAIEHGHLLPGDVSTGIEVAVARCVAGEPAGRIPPWYTNPNLLHAWLQGHVGVAQQNAALVAAGLERVDMVTERFERFGDVDEYNAPTYDGIDLLALALWVQYPPDRRYRRAGETIIERVAARIGTLYHPALGATCGPYIRAYGLELRRYVSLVGSWLHVVGEPAEAVMPAVLDQDAVHVHDLYFFPIIQHLAPSVAPHLEVRAVTSERRHRQCFDDTQSESLLYPDLAVGWEHGRRQEFSLDQYVPFTAHLVVDGRPASVGVMVPDETAWVDCRRMADSRTALEFDVRATGRSAEVGLRIAVGTQASVTRGRVIVGACTIVFERPADEIIDAHTPSGGEIRLRWATPDVASRITVEREPA